MTVAHACPIWGSDNPCLALWGCNDFGSPYWTFALSPKITMPCLVHGAIVPSLGHIVLMKKFIAWGGGDNYCDLYVLEMNGAHGGVVSVNPQ